VLLLATQSIACDTERTDVQSQGVHALETTPPHDTLGDDATLGNDATESDAPIVEDPTTPHEQTILYPPIDLASEARRTVAVGIVVFEMQGSRIEQVELSRHIVTDYRVTTVQAFRGQLPDVVAVPGGTLGDRTEIRYDAAPVRAGEQILAFFVTTARGPFLSRTAEIRSDGMAYVGEWIPLSQISTIMQTQGAM
jgi:hypothetical protein